MSTGENSNEVHGGGSGLNVELDGSDIKSIVNEIMPEVIRLAAATGQGPLHTLVNIAQAAGRKEHPDTIERIGHEYLWQHRHEVPWAIQPPPNA
jgi:hypothetical protein